MSGGHRAAVLVVRPAAEQPTPAALDRLAREYGLKDELDGAWALRPLELVREGGRTMLVLEDTRSEPLERWLGAPMEVRELSAPRHRGRGGSHTGPPARPRPQGHQAGKYPGGPGDRNSQAYWFRHRFASAARAAGARAARVDRGHARLYGARADRAGEPVDRRPQRPLRPRRHALPDDHGFTAVYRGRSDGMGPLPYRQKAAAAERAAGDCAGRGLRPHPETARQDAEERYQTAAGLERDLRRCLAAWEARAQDRRLPAGSTGHVRPAFDSREAVRARARDRDFACRLRPCRHQRPA